MKPAPSKTPQSNPEATTSWAEVARASAEIKEVPAAATCEEFPDAATDEEFPGGDELRAGDSVDHERFGSCTVHRIVGEFVHMAPENGRVIKLSNNILSFTPAFIEDGRRVFSTSKRQ